MAGIPENDEECNNFEEELHKLAEKVKRTKVCAKPEIIQTSSPSTANVTTSTSDRHYSMGFTFKTQIYEDQSNRSWAIHEVVDVKSGGVAEEIGLL